MEKELTIDILSSVQKPARYTGGEFGSIIKPAEEVEATIALAFPDVYEVGMSYLGFKILYHLLNKTAGVQAERVYAPWVDMEAKMRERNIPLRTLETEKTLAECDIVGFTLQYELSYTNILNMLELGNVPVLAADRKDEDPFVIVGGPCVYNPEPLADFFDFAIIGEGEEIMIEVMEAYKAWKKAGKVGGRQGFLNEVVKIQGIYVPSFYETVYNEDGTVAEVKVINEAAPAAVEKRVVKDMNTIDFPDAPIVPFNDIVHDRIMLEVFRGCTRGCRFCHAGMVYRPIRERKPEVLKELARKLVDNTGYNEMSLVSLSSADYSCLAPLVHDLIAEFKDERKSGWNSVKLYFMIGLPFETDEDILAIADLAKKVQYKYYEITGKRGCKVTVSASGFVPKPYTAFQWFAQNDIETLRRKQFLLKDALKVKNITFQYHDAKTSIVEAIFARGDRRLGKVLLTAWQKGARFDGWSDCFSYDRWLESMAECGLDKDFYAARTRGENEVFPWEHVQPAVSRRFLWREWEKAQAQELTQSVVPNCLLLIPKASTRT